VTPRSTSVIEQLIAEAEQRLGLYVQCRNRLLYLGNPTEPAGGNIERCEATIAAIEFEIRVLWSDLAVARQLDQAAVLE
jgi:hypothetical protein